MLSNEDGMSAHGRLPAVIPGFPWGQAAPDEDFRVAHNLFQAAPGKIGRIVLTQPLSAAKLTARQRVK